MEQPTIVAYSPNDFFWHAISNDPNAPKDCTLVQSIPDSICAIDNSLNCFQSAYCQNKNNSQIIANQQSTHTAADGRLHDTKNDYFVKLQTIINLGIGIVGIGGFIYLNQ